VFILFSNTPIVWCGGKSTGDARQASRRLAPRNAPLVAEGKEDDEFWAELGGETFLIILIII
jgi:villin 1